MFGFKKRSEDVKMVAFTSLCEGRVIPITQVPDMMFADKLLGDGAAFTYDTSTIYAPCDGEIIMTSKTNHAIGIRANNGAEILIHCGLETVNLKGKGLKILVKENQKVKRGKAILKIDREFMDENKVNLVTPMIVTNGSDYKLEIVHDDVQVDLNTVVFRVTKI